MSATTPYEVYVKKLDAIGEELNKIEQKFPIIENYIAEFYELNKQLDDDFFIFREKLLLIKQQLSELEE